MNDIKQPPKENAKPVAAKDEASQEIALKTTPHAKQATAKVPAKKPVSNKTTGPNSAPTKSADKPSAKASKPAAKVQAKPKINSQTKAVKVKEKQAATAKQAKQDKVKIPAPKKPNLVRDSFTFPERDYALIGDLKQRAVSTGREVKKSEILRAGLVVLAAMSDIQLRKALDKIERIKTGRPAQ